MVNIDIVVVAMLVAVNVFALMAIYKFGARNPTIVVVDASPGTSLGAATAHEGIDLSFFF